MLSRLRLLRRLKTHYGEERKRVLLKQSMHLDVNRWPSAPNSGPVPSPPHPPPFPEAKVVTLWYRCPELLLGSDIYSTAVDLWAAGCILGELLLGKPLMPGKTDLDQVHKIFKVMNFQK